MRRARHNVVRRVGAALRVVRWCFRAVGGSPIGRLLVFAALVAAAVLWWPVEGIQWLPIVAVVVGAAGFLSVLAVSFGPRVFRTAFVVLLTFAVVDLVVVGAEHPLGQFTVAAAAGDSQASGSDLAASEDGEAAQRVSLLGHIERGGEVRISQLLPPSIGDVAVGAVGWFLLLVIGVLGWRRLENVNARRTSTPVVVEPFTTPSDFTRGAQLTEMMENGLANAGIVEPASIPGGQVTGELVQIFDKDPGPATWMTPLLRLLTVAVPKRGTVVVPTLECVDPPRVSVRVVTARQRRTLYARSFAEPTLERTVRRAAAYVGQNAFSYGKTTPRWARWPESDGEAFSLFVDALTGVSLPRALGNFRDLRNPEGPDNRSLQMKALQMALTQNPTNGIARVELGQCYELQDDGGGRWRALRLYLEATYDHERLLVARYRAATSLSLFAGDIQHGNIALVDPRDRRSIAAITKSVLQTKRMGEWQLEWFWAQMPTRNGPNVDAENEGVVALRQDGLEQNFIALARRALGQCQADLRSWRLLLNACKYEDERQYWLDLWSNKARRDRLREQIKVVGLILDLREYSRSQRTRETRGTIPKRESIFRWCREALKSAHQLGVDGDPGISLKIEEVISALSEALDQCGRYRSQIRRYSNQHNRVVEALFKARVEVWHLRKLLRKPGREQLVQSPALDRVDASLSRACRLLSKREMGVRTRGDGDRLEEIKAKLNVLIDTNRRREIGAGVLYNAACLYGVLVTIDEANAEEYRGQAIGLLHQARRAVGGGFPSAAWLCKDPDLKALHGDEAFQEIVRLTSRAETRLAAVRDKRDGTEESARPEGDRLESLVSRD